MKIVKENGLNFDEVILDVNKFIQKKLNKAEAENEKEIKA